MIPRGSTLAYGALAAWIAGTAHADTVTFNFAQVGSSYSAFLPGDSPLVGQEIVKARIYLDVEITGGNSAAFFTDISFPIIPLDGNTNAIVLTGEELNWNGHGTFNYFLETEMFNGHFAPGRYGAETPGEGYQGTILATSRIEFDSIPAPGTLPVLALAGLATARRRR